MSEKSNKFLKDFKKSAYNSNATEDIVKSLVEMPHEQAVQPPVTATQPQTEEEQEQSVISTDEVNAAEDLAVQEKKNAKKTAKKGEKKSKAGRKPFKTGEYKKITIDIPLEIYEAMQDFLGAFDNNMTSYIKNALTRDINQNYEEYVKKAKQLKESTPMLTIKRK